MPPYVIIVIINIYILPPVGNGPIWDVNNSPGRYQECKEYFWSKVLMINDFIGTDVSNFVNKVIRFFKNFLHFKCMVWNFKYFILNKNYIFKNYITTIQ